jgi:hypothetical protein
VKTTVFSSYINQKKTTLCANGDFVSVFTATPTNNNGFSVVRYNSDGDLVWNAEYNNSNMFVCAGINVVETPGGDLVISFMGQPLNSTNRIGGLFCINSQGVLIWEKQYRSGFSPGYEFVVGSELTVGSDGSIYMALSEINLLANPSTESALLFRFSASGNLVWSKVIGSAPLKIMKILPAFSNGLHIGATNPVSGAFYMLRTDTLGNILDTKNYSPGGIVVDFVTDQNNQLKALLVANSLAFTRLIELDTTGNVSAARDATISIPSRATNLIYRNGNYFSGHYVSGNGTILCNWSSSSSANNAKVYTGTDIFSTNTYCQIADGSIYMFGYAIVSTQTTRTRTVKSEALVGNDFSATGCSQVSDNFTIVPASVGNPVTVNFSSVNYSPVVDIPAFQRITATVSIINNCSVISTQEFTAESFEIYPNPAIGELVVTGNFSSDAIAEIYSVSGTQIMGMEIQCEGNNLKINTSNLSAGVYLLKITDSNKNFRPVRFVINR